MKQDRAAVLRSGLGAGTFGRVFTDHVLVARCERGAWSEAAVEPYGRFELAPSCSAFHYGQEIFEGMKVFAAADGRLLAFRPRDHFERMNRSARRMCMPEIPAEVFLDGLARLVRTDREWVPTTPGHALYLRPVLFAADECVGVRESETYRFAILACPAGVYHRPSVSLFVSPELVRSHEGGTGDVKTAGNYGAGLLATRQAKALGHDEVLWVDARTRRHVEECGTMNVFFVLGETVVTPPATGTILPGITRASVLHLLRESGARVEERPVTVEELFRAGAAGALRECFGTGTAASIQRVGRIGSRERTIELPAAASTDGMAAELDARLRAVRTGAVEAPPGWIVEL